MVSQRGFIRWGQTRCVQTRALPPKATIQISALNTSVSRNRSILAHARPMRVERARARKSVSIPSTAAR